LNENYPSAKITPEHKRQRKLRRLPAEAVQLTSSGRISISKPEWMEASGDDTTFIKKDWNSQVKNNKKTDNLVTPPGTKLIPSDGGSKKEQQIGQQVAQLAGL
jgi:hypothetical protein